MLTMLRLVKGGTNLEVWSWEGGSTLWALVPSSLHQGSHLPAQSALGSVVWVGCEGEGYPTVHPAGR